MGASDLGDHGYCRCLLASQPRSYPQSIEAVCINSFGECRLFMVHVQDRLRDRYLHDSVVLLRCVYRDLSRTAAHTGTCGKDGCTRHTVAAGNDECIAHVAFVCEVVAIEQA